MDIYESFRLVAATGCGMQMGAFLIISLFHKPLFLKWPREITSAELFKRLYRLCTVIAIISGVLAIFGEAREAGFLLAILGMSYILLLTHLLPAITKLHYKIDAGSTIKQRRSPEEIIGFLKIIQISSHFLQFLVLLYLVYRLI